MEDLLRKPQSEGEEPKPSEIVLENRSKDVPKAQQDMTNTQLSRPNPSTLLLSEDQTTEMK